MSEVETTCISDFDCHVSTIELGRPLAKMRQNKPSKLDLSIQVDSPGSGQINPIRQPMRVNPNSTRQYVQVRNGDLNPSWQVGGPTCVTCMFNLTVKVSTNHSNIHNSKWNEVSYLRFSIYNKISIKTAFKIEFKRESLAISSHIPPWLHDFFKLILHDRDLWLFHI